MSSDTPHWYIRDYLARVSRHYGINEVAVDGKILFNFKHKDIKIGLYTFKAGCNTLLEKVPCSRGTRFLHSLSSHIETWSESLCIVSTSSVLTDLDECKAKEAACVYPAFCANTYGGYRCVCNSTDVDETQSCVIGKHTHGLLFLRPPPQVHLTLFVLTGPFQTEAKQVRPRWTWFWAWFLALAFLCSCCCSWLH